jgi:hypothetical protein
MISTAQIVELDRFRRVREALHAMSRPIRREARPLQAVDWYLPGIVGKARVSTSFGDLPIEALRPRDDVRSYFGATAQVQVVDKIHLDQDFLRSFPGALPIRIPANSIGPGRPSNDLFISPGQEISLDAHVATAFQKAQNLSGRFRMDLTYSTGLTYYRFHCGSPVVIKVEGIWLRINPWAVAP